MIDLSINTDLARTILTGFIQTEVFRAGFSRAVINLKRANVADSICDRVQNYS